MVYLIPTVLADDGLQTIPAYVLDAIKKCDVFFVENEKTTRQYFKKLWKEMVIDDYKWHTIHKAEIEVQQDFTKYLEQNKTIGIVSEAGCPCIADPGQLLVAKAQQLNKKVIPLVGPSSILMALMASGFNGQHFSFIGYLPIDATERKNKLKEIELHSQKNNATQIFIETPYRNNNLIKDIIASCKPQTKLCIAANISAGNESILTKSLNDWKKLDFDYHKMPTIFLLQS